MPPTTPAERYVSEVNQLRAIALLQMSALSWMIGFQEGKDPEWTPPLDVTRALEMSQEFFCE